MAKSATDGGAAPIILVDGHGLAFKAFHALPLLSSPDGTPTNVILGFMNMLVKIEQELRPKSVALFFDPKGKTARHTQHPAYKEGRAPTPPEFKTQLPILQELLALLGYPVAVQDGTEADDAIIATAKLQREECENVLILTSDKDILQALAFGVPVMRPTKGVSEFKLYDEEFFTAEYGFAPRYMSDYLALTGDKADNIAGVAGIGEKQATALIAKYGALEDIYAHIDELKEAQRARLVAGKDTAFSSRELIRPYPAIALAVTDLTRKDRDANAAFELCQKLGLKQLIKKLNLFKSNLFDLPQQTPIISECDNITDYEDYHTIFDYKKLCGSEQKDLQYSKIWDVKLANYGIHPDASLKEVEERAKGLNNQELLSWRNEIESSSRWPLVRELVLGPDTQLSPVLASMERHGLGVDTGKLQILEGAIQKNIRALEFEILNIAGCEVNLNSPKQVGALLFEKLGLPPSKKGKTGYSTDVEVLTELAKLPSPFGDVPRLMLEHREISKILSGFVQPFLHLGASGKLHTSFEQTGTGTGRLTSHSPNVQNLPTFGELSAQFRDAIVPVGEGNIFLSADYSQIELRILAHYCEEKRLLDAFEAGLDIHTQTASWIYGLAESEITQQERRFAKVVNFGLLYGMTSHGLAARMGIPQRSAQEIVNKYFAALPKVKEYLADTVAQAKENGYTSTLFGRIRPLDEVRTIDGRGHGAIDRVAINSPIQGTASDIARFAMIKLHAAMREKFRGASLVMQVHDSLVCEVSAEDAEGLTQLLKKTMSEAGEYKDKKLKVPLSTATKSGSSLAYV